MASPCRRARGYGHEPDDGDYRARDAQVFPVADADDGVDGDAAGTADRAGECLWRKDPRRDDAQVFPVADADDGVDGDAAGTADRAGECLWRKDPRREDAQVFPVADADD